MFLRNLISEIFLGIFFCKNEMLFEVHKKISKNDRFWKCLEQVFLENVCVTSKHCFSQICRKNLKSGLIPKSVDETASFFINTQKC